MTETVALDDSCENYVTPKPPENNYNRRARRARVEQAIPGQKIASIEECEAGDNTFDDGDSVRSAVAGEVLMDRDSRTAAVSWTKRPLIARAGDTVVGTVAATMAFMIAVRIDYVNGVRTSAGVECICSTRNMRKRTLALVGDVVALKIMSLRNGALHATVSEPELGVLFTKCRKCGQTVMQYRDAVKCKECGWIDDRKLSSQFGKAAFMR